MDDPATLTLRDFAEQPRTALMWTPRALDVARIAAAARAVAADPARPRALDAGAGSGLLARLVADEGVDVVAVDAEDADQPARGVGRFFHVIRERVQDVPLERSDVALVSWMEAGRDYREAVAARARVIVEASDPAGGCGIRGETGFAEFGLVRAAAWPTPSHEDVAHALRTRGRAPDGRGLVRKGAPGNVVEAWAREEDAARVAGAVAGAAATRRLPWEDALDAVVPAPP